ncbi:Proton/sodium-glutamate symport protein [Desulforapulum autotrophicum HRM2]|uniref:Proton/sodium-glutamate symport protein n=1 Tax=Desulforapulum autotrophicum (strain ATCC 43914 / DSM 3382 / VKM B-1955 / HRM2) TaxID=177437 RepID=C0QG58_DESAH|nr:dicarboxylate/amino acid:cation symporter [Desulforapulum autotrophicum]ACN17637.1 Proton/sodium-glutamate symport protein [Desulforapulum autotrophicum HRM2]
MKVLNWYFKSNLLIRILLGLILGAVAGLFFGPQIAVISPLGDIFVRLLKMIVMPVVILTLVVGAASIQPARLGKVGGKTVLFYMLTTGFAVGIGLLMGNIFHPGAGMDLAGVSSEFGKALTKPSMLDTLVNIIPKNPFTAVSSGQILPTIFFTLIFGIGLAFIRDSEEERIRDAAETVFRFFEGGAEVIYKMVNWILQYAPIGVFALIAVVFGKQGAQAFGPLGILTLSFYLGIVIHAVLVYGGLLAFFGISPIQFFSRAKEATITAFVTRSSGGTLPVTLGIAQKKMGVSKGVFSFTLPLGATINMDGNAIYQGVCAIFIGFAIGSPLTIDQQFTVIITAVLASIGAAGVPGAGAIMLLLVLNSVGLKVEPGTTVAMAYAMIFGIDALLDMGRTALNVTGDLAVTCAVAKSEKELDQAIWNDGGDSKKMSKVA